jgi:hypothetical protein
MSTTWRPLEAEHDSCSASDRHSPLAIRAHAARRGTAKAALGVATTSPWSANFELIEVIDAKAFLRRTRVVADVMSFRRPGQRPRLPGQALQGFSARL